MAPRLRGTVCLPTAAMVVAAFLAVSAQERGAAAGTAGQPQPAPQGRGRGPAEPPQPTPRLADGTVNLGRVVGEKGIWNVPYITNMGMRVVGRQRQAARSGGRTPRRTRRRAAARRSAAAKARQAAAAAARSPSRGCRFSRGPRRSTTTTRRTSPSTIPEGYCLPPGGPRMMATPYPAEIIQLPEQKRIIMIFEGATHIWREIYMDGRPHPEGRRAQPDLPRPLRRPLGRRHARRRRRRLQRSDVARLLRPSAHRPAARRRALLAAEQAARCTTKRRSTIRAPTRSRSRSRGTFRGARTASCPNTSARRTTSTCSG